LEQLVLREDRQAHILIGGLTGLRNASILAY